jgi:predicted lysophospholipase L1 biosynthesis ABC-type transport system permease subunit
MNYLIHARPFIHPYAYSIIILLFTIIIVVVFILLLLLLFCYFYYYKTIATDKILRASLFPGAAGLTTHLLRLINILLLPLCRIN